MATIQSVAGPANFTTYGAGRSLDFTLTFDEAVTVDTTGGTPYLDLIVGAAHVPVSYLSGSGGTALVFRYVVQAGEIDSDGVELVGPEALSNGGSITNAALQPADLHLPAFGQIPGVRVDGVAPAVASVGVPANGTYKAGDNLDFTVNFDEAVTINTAGGTPRIAVTLDTGGTAYATYVSGSGTAAVIFRYTVPSGVLDGNGITVGSLSANGGTLQDTGGNDATLTLNSVGSTAAVLVDGMAPAVTSVTVPANGTYRTGDNLDFTVNLNEAATVSTAGGTPRIALTLDTGGTVYADYLSGSGTSALLFRHTVASGEADANGVSVGALSANGGTILDAVGNDANLTLNSVGSTAAVLVDAVVELSIAATSASKAEGSAGGATPFTFTVTRAGDTTGASSTDYAVTGSGGSPADAVDFGGALPQGTVSFAAGETSKLVTVSVSADTTAEVDEGFTVTLSNAVGGTIGTATAAGTITNDDAQPADPSPGPITGTSGPDTLDGGATDDEFAGGDGADNLRGFGGNDSVDGGTGADTVNGNAGNDTVHGGDGGDVVFGGKDNDLVDGGAGNDLHVNGNLGADTVHGGDGNDTVYGGQDNDSVHGDAGDDHISGDLGDDNLFGGAGADRFAFGAGFGHDWIADFDPAGGDRIELRAGTTFTVTSHMGQTVIDLGGGAMLGLVGTSGFDPNWIAFV